MNIILKYIIILDLLCMVIFIMLHCIYTIYLVVIFVYMLYMVVFGCILYVVDLVTNGLLIW